MITLKPIIKKNNALNIIRNKNKKGFQYIGTIQKPFKNSLFNFMFNVTIEGNSKKDLIKKFRDY